MRRRLLLLGALFLSLPACGNLFDPAAAVANGEKITMEQIEEALERFEETEEFQRLAEQGDARAVRREYQQGKLSQLVRQKVMRPEARRLGIEVTDEEVEDALAAIKQEFPSEEAFEETVTSQGFTLPEVRVLLRDELIERRLKEKVTEDVTVDEAEARRLYEENIDRYTQTRIQHILLGEQDKALAAELAARLQAAPAGKVERLFEQLARKHSEDAATARRGGDLGYSSAGQFVAPFDEAAAALDEGEVSDPVETEFGIHVLRVMDRRTQAFEEVRQAIEEELSEERIEEAWRDWIVEAYEEADVRVNPRFGELDVESQRIVDAGPGMVPGTEPSPSPAETPPALQPTG